MGSLVRVQSIGDTCEGMGAFLPLETVFDLFALALRLLFHFTAEGFADTVSIVLPDMPDLSFILTSSRSILIFFLSSVTMHFHRGFDFDMAHSPFNCAAVKLFSEDPSPAAIYHLLFPLVQTYRYPIQWPYPKTAQGKKGVTIKTLNQPLLLRIVKKKKGSHHCNPFISPPSLKIRRSQEVPRGFVGII